MPKFSIPSTRKSRRYSSESSSLSPPALSSIGASDPARPSSSSRLLHKPTGGTPISEVLKYNDRQPKPSNLATVRRPSDQSNTRPQDMSEDASGRNRWSSSTTSSTSATKHRRHSSFSKRFSLGASSLNSGFRSLSPNKMNRLEESLPDHANVPGSEASAASLPSINGFSPITLPNLTYGSVDKSQAPTRSLPAPPVDNSQASAHHVSRGDEARLNGATSPMKRHRELTSRGGSHLSDIMEIDRNTGLASSPRGHATSASPTRTAVQNRSRSRRANSRDASPSKPGSDSGRPGTQGSSQSNDASPSGLARRRSKKDKDKKIILSRALKRANEAVMLDNEQDYVSAVAAYEEACGLLDLVMLRTHAESEKLKLTTIRGTYLSRIEELQHIHQRPWSLQGQGDSSIATGTGIPIRDSLDSALSQDLDNNPLPPVLSSSRDNGPTIQRSQRSSPPTAHERIFGTQPLQRHISETIAPALQPNGDRDLPSPLSPRRSPIEAVETDRETSPSRQEHRESGVNHAQHASTSDAGSWFNASGDEAVSSAHSRNHSVSSYDGVRRKDLRTQALSTEAEFDAALDAAIESAYPDGFEPYDGDEYNPGIGLATSMPSRVSNPLADQAQSYVQRQANIQRLSRSRNPNDSDTINDLSEIESGIDSDEEDRLLDVGRECTDARGYEAEPELQPPGPRQSGSSGFTGRTFASSAGSSLTTAGTSLGTVDENASLPSLNPKKYNPDVSPSRDTEGMLARPHDKHLSGQARVGEQPGPSRSRSPLRERRLSAQKAKGQLRIETSVSTEASPERSKPQDKVQTSIVARSDPPQNMQLTSKPSSTSTGSAQARAAFRSDLNRTNSPYPSPYAGAFPQDVTTPPTPSLQKTLSNEGACQGSPFNSPPRRSERPAVKQNISSMSLGRHVLQGGRTPDEADDSGAAMDFAFPASRSPPQPHEGQLGQPMSTPLESTFGSPPAVTSAKMKIFDSEIHSSMPGAPNPEMADGPRPLEPCPESVLLRPFWLMRCFYQTLVHSKGGYVTARLFVPHDVWKVKNVKLKNVEEKIANCDLLTAALLKLSSVDTLDADAVLEEMESFETVLNQAQTSLSKKLGNEVGIHGISALFKEAPSGSSPPSGDPNASHTGNEGTTASTGGKTSSKGYLSSWRKLRSKSSTTNLATGYAASREMPKEGSTMSSLPMTTNIGARRSIGKRERSGSGSQGSTAVQIEGPNANYAGALARLCDAAQALDQIARQVEDPGLKLSSPTHVGLELSTRHAAEFFGFYVCRFILQDLTMLTEKFVKRASEWVVA